MQHRTSYLSILSSLWIAALLFTGCDHTNTPSTPVVPSTYVATPTVADTAGFGATVIDTNLKNPWGIVAAPSSKFWIANNHAGGVGIYDPVTGAASHEFVIADSIGANPTGIVYNSDPTAFIIGSSGSSSYIFASEDGVLWGFSSTAFGISQAVASTGTSNFKGIALGTRFGATALFAANFKNGSLDVFDRNFKRLGQFNDTSSGSASMQAGFAPFNVTNLNGTIYVSYAKQKGDGDDLSGLGNGYIDIFHPDTAYMTRLISNGNLNSPWGMAIAPDNFGDFKGKLLVGNFGDGKINVYDPASGSYLGQLKDASGNVIVISGLWSLYVYNNILYYTAGPDDEDHGVLGKITLH